MFLRIASVLALVAMVAGQGNLNSFSAMKNALLEGSELQLNAHSDLCETVGLDANDTMLVSMPLRQWQIIKDADGEVLRADDFYISTMDLAMVNYVTRHILVNTDNTVEVALAASAAPDAPITMNCELGDGAMVHRVVPGNDLVEIDTYQEVKSLLLAGDHIEAVGELGQCRNAGDVLPDGQEYTVGYQILRFTVANDGTPDEYIFVDDVAVLTTADAASYSIGTEALVLYPDDTVTAIVAVFDANLGVITNFTLECDYDNAIKFDYHQRENPNTYVTYEEIREATLDGHDMEAVVFLEFCEVQTGEQVDFTGQISSARFDQFQLFEAGPVWGDSEYIAFSTYGLSVTGALNADVVRVFANGTVEIEYFLVDAGAMAETATGIITCPLEDSVVFHAVQRTRAPIQDFAQIISDIETQGQTFEVEINFDLCQSEVELDSVFGGIVWQTYVNPDPIEGYYYGNVFALVQQDLSATVGPAWDAAGILVLPDNSVMVTVALYDYFTGENLVAGMGDGDIQCSLDDGSVVFYRYP